MDIKLELELQEVNGIIAVLAQLPFSQIHGLIDKIRNQAIAQVQAAQPAEQAQNETEAEPAAE